MDCTQTADLLPQFGQALSPNILTLTKLLLTLPEIILKISFSSLMTGSLIGPELECPEIIEFHLWVLLLS